jgi:hypothetical protein
MGRERGYPMATVPNAGIRNRFRFFLFQLAYSLSVSPSGGVFPQES